MYISYQIFCKHVWNSAQGSPKKASAFQWLILNFTFVNIKLQVLEEKCVFTPSQENKDWTRLERHVWVNSGLYGVSRAIMAFGVERYKANMAKSNKGLQYIIDKLFVPDKIPDTLPQEVTKLRDSATAKAKDMAAQARGVVQ